ncbi:MAG TPA: ATP-binding protein [Chloroflexota bacterium]|nr:ATP-binding protein [Chloroflexota bacterium]
MQLYVLTLAIAGAYLALLFGIAYFADKQRERGRSLIANPYIYALSLAVYCTAWTFYGSVGRAAETGLGFLPVYLGPTLIALTWWSLLRKIVRVAKENRLTTIADFLSARYGNSTALGVLVSVMVVIGIMPYTALQLKAISSTFETLEAAYWPADTPPPQLGMDTAFIVAVFMSIFGIMFGARHLAPAERHEGMVAAVAFESVVKLLAFVSVGAFVTFGVYHGFGDLFARAAAVPAYRELFVLGSPTSVSFASWLSITVLSAAAVMFLPRQFHVAVVENVAEAHIRKAMWLFPLYLLAINVFVLPMAFAGLLTFGYQPLASDLFVLTLPIHYGQPALALFAFIGGLSAATAMLVVESVAVATVVLNNLVVPLVVKLGGMRDVSHWLLTGRRLAIVAVIMLGYLCFQLVGESYTLVNLGLISFAAAFQFAPPILCGLYLRWVSRRGAILGLGLGFAVWTYTLVVPTLAQSGLLPRELVEQGPFGLAALRPTALLGLEGLDPWSHTLFWSLVLNLGGLLLGSLYMPPVGAEVSQARKFVDCFETPDRAETGPPSLAGNLAEELQALMARFIGAPRAAALMTHYLQQWGIPPGGQVPWPLQADLIAFVERELAGSLGPASAHILVDSYVRQREPALEKIIDAFGEVSLSLEQSREDLSRRVRELSILYALSTRLSSSLALPEIVQAVEDLLTAEFSLDGVEVLLAGPDGRLAALQNRAQARPPGRPAELAACPAARRAFHERRLVTSQDAAAQPGDAPEPIRSYLAAPICAGESTLGVLFGYSAQSLVYFSPEFLQLVQVVATQVGSAVKNAQLYEELRLLSLDLDRKVRERTAELERANEQLREVDRLKSEFLSVVAHEFRTPLTSICSFAEILLHYDTLDATQRRRFVEIINEEGQRLTRLISQVLDISRIESGKLELRLEYHDLRAIVAAAFQIAEPVAGRRGIRLCFDAPAALPPVYVDRDRVLQVITNLLSNAVQLSPPGETVRVAALPADGMLEISVADRGPGVPPAYREAIFEKFVRVEGHPGRGEGTGLGLFVSRQIIEHHGGRIWVVDHPGGGADFRFTLPCGAPPARLA